MNSDCIKIKMISKKLLLIKKEPMFDQSNYIYIIITISLKVQKKLNLVIFYFT